MPYGTLTIKAVEGPSGPHLFRMSQESVDVLDDRQLSMSPPESPELARRVTVPQMQQTLQHQHEQLQYLEQLQLDQLHEYQQQGHKQPRQRSVPAREEQGQRQRDRAFSPPPRTSVPLRTWTPWQVADWMNAQGFEQTIIEQFFINDISGVTLIDLQYDDLKELGISSFGQRHRLWTEIRALKDGNLSDSQPPTPGQDFPWAPHAASDPAALSQPHLQAEDIQQIQRQPSPPGKCSTPDTPEEGEMPAKSGRRGMRRALGPDDIVSPAESASIVAIEQLLPKPHKCKAGKDCRKWKKRQKKLDRIATEFPAEMAQILEAQQSPGLDSGVGQPSSIAVPSIVASSDALGPVAQKIGLHEDDLRVVASRDPQENVRQFLSFQHVDTPTKDEPTTPPYEMFPPLAPPQPVNPHTNLRSLPKLTIPASSPPSRALTVSAGGDRTAVPRRGTTPVTAVYGRGAAGHDIYRLGSPASEMDVPVTALPAGPIERDASSSVPPDMRYGGTNILLSRSSSRAGQPYVDIASPRDRRPPPAFLNPSTIKRSASHAGARSRRPSQGMAPLAENLSSPHDEEARTPVAPPRPTATTAPDPDGAAHAGWMKKRRTRLLRHEWTEAHYRLRGTQLAMHADGGARGGPLESIDVDQYAVAVAANQSKLNAAMRRLQLNRRNGEEVWKYGFQLTPAATADRDAGSRRFAATAKTHHFAVRNQNERIDWMRELMLARAKKGKEAVHERFE